MKSETGLTDEKGLHDRFYNCRDKHERVELCQPLVLETIGNITCDDSVV